MGSAYCSTSQLSTNDCILLDLFYKLTTVILSVVADVPGDNDAHTVNSFILKITQTLRGAHRIRGACLYSRSDCARVCNDLHLYYALEGKKSCQRDNIRKERTKSILLPSPNNPLYPLNQRTKFRILS